MNKWPTYFFEFSDLGLVYIACFVVYLILLFNVFIHLFYKNSLAKKVLPLVFLSLAYSLSVAIGFTGKFKNSDAVFLLSINGILGTLTFYFYSKIMQGYFAIPSQRLLVQQRILLSAVFGAFVVAIVSIIFPDLVIDSENTHAIKISELTLFMFPSSFPSKWTPIPIFISFLGTVWSLAVIIVHTWRDKKSEPLIFFGIIFSITAMINDISIGMGILNSHFLIMPFAYIFETLRFQWLIAAQTHEKMDRLKLEISESRSAQNNYAYIRLLGHEVRKTVRRITEKIKPEDFDKNNLQTLNSLIDIVQSTTLDQKPKQTFELGKVWQAVLQYHDDEIEKSHIKIKSQTKKDLMITGYEKEFFFVLSNLLKNSIDAVRTCVKKEIEFKSFEDGNCVVIEFNDSGPGIPADQREDLFEIPLKSEKRDGHGVGLVIVQELLKRNSGFILVKERPKTGFQIKIYR